MISLNTNLPAQNAANNFNNHYSKLATSAQRLSSGLRINSAADDASGLAVRELMRTDIAAIHQGIRNASDAISMIQVADGALSVIDEKLIRMKELAEQAATGTYDSTQRLMIDSEFQAMREDIDRIARTTDFNGIKLLDYKKAAGNGTVTPDGGYENHIPDIKPAPDEESAAKAGQGVSVQDGRYDWYKQINGYDVYQKVIVPEIEKDWTPMQDEMEFVFGPNSDPGKLLSVTEITLIRNGYLPLDDGSYLSFYRGLGDEGQSYSIAYDVDAQKASALKNGSALPTGLDLVGDEVQSIYFDDGGTRNKIFYYNEKGEDVNFNKSFTRTYVVSDNPNANFFFTENENFDILDTRISGWSLVSGSAHLVGDEYSDDSIYFDMYLESYGWPPYVTFQLTVIDPNATDDTDLPDNPDTPDLPTPVSDIPPDKVKIHFGPMNDAGEDYYYINKHDATREGLGLEGVKVQTQDEAQSALVTINDAIVAKDKIRAEYGTMQNRLENTFTNLTIQAENLQTAESRISDTDIATEMTEFVRNQVLAQSALAMIAQANSMPQISMRLIG